ncbi:MAG: hypothetical protein ACXWL2_01215 [Candidatus Chromulinivorax sp.]
MATNNYIFNSDSIKKTSERFWLLNELENKTNQHIAEYGKEMQEGWCFCFYGCSSKRRDVNSDIGLPLVLNRALWTLLLEDELKNKKRLFS